MIARIFFAALMTLAAAAAQTAQRPAARPAPPRNANPVAPPAGAEKLSDGVFRAKDSAGKVWIYTRTPFGFAKHEEGAAPAAPRPEVPAFRVLEVKGGTVRFERDTPFGKSVWTRPVAQLDEKEKAAYESYQASHAGAEKAGQ
jgi:hypothetical protein